MAFWNKSFPSSRDPTMKPIEYRGGVVTFRIPSHWREEYSNFNGGTFYEDCAESGTLRLKIISTVAPKRLHAGSAMDVLGVAIDHLNKVGGEGTTWVRKDGNAVLKCEETTSELGTSLTIFYWVVANPLPPHHTRIATFSYTVLAKQRNEPQIQRDLEALESEIESATFSPGLGVVPE